MFLSYDYKQLALLFVLYVIQAVPLGLSAAIPLLLQARGVSFSNLAIYSIASLPFSLKLIWAPVVDSTHLPHLGRRKSWLIPTQIGCGIVMLIVGHLNYPSKWVASGAVTELTIFFTLLYFLMATQDIAVDGWALEILAPSRKQ